MRTLYSHASVKWLLRFSLLMLGINVIIILIILDIYSELNIISSMITAFLDAQ